MLTVSDGRKINWALMPLNEMAIGNVTDSYFTLELYYILKDKLKELGLESHYETLLCPLTIILAEVEYNGMLIDKSKLDEIGPNLKRESDEAKDKLYAFKQVRKEDKVSSPKDLVQIFYLRDDGFKLYPPFKTKKTNQPQTDKDTLETLETMIEEELEQRK